MERAGAQGVQRLRMMKALLPAVLVSLLSPACFPQEQKIDTNRSSITVHVGKSGLFSAAAHEHDVSAPIASGMLDEANTRVELAVDARKMKVQPDPKINAKDEAEMQSTMQRKVIESEK